MNAICATANVIAWNVCITVNTYILWKVAKAAQRITAQTPANTNRFVGFILSTNLLEKIKKIISAITDTFKITPDNHLADIFILSKYIAL